MKKHFVFVSLIAVCIVMFIITTWCPIYVVEGESMNPALVNNDVVCIKKTKFIKHGDLIVFQYNNKLLVRRVIGLSGDKINIDPSGYVFVNEKRVR